MYNILLAEIEKAPDVSDREVYEELLQYRHHEKLNVFLAENGGNYIALYQKLQQISQLQVGITKVPFVLLINRLSQLPGLRIVKYL